MYEYLSQFGKVRTLKLHSKRTGESRGFGFATYESLADLEKAIQTDHSIRGKTFECKKVVSQEEAKLKEKMLLKRKIFVGGLDKAVDEDELAQYFNKFGIVEKVIISREHYTNISRGCGFVIFKSIKSAKKTLYFKGVHKLHGKQFGCKSCKSRDEVNEKAPKQNNFDHQNQKEERNIVQKSPQQSLKRRQREQILKKASQGTSLQHSGRVQSSDNNSSNVRERQENQKLAQWHGQNSRNYYPKYSHHPQQMNSSNWNQENFGRGQALKSTEMLNEMSQMLGFADYQHSLTNSRGYRTPLNAYEYPPMLMRNLQASKKFKSRSYRMRCQQNTNICFNLPRME